MNKSDGELGERTNCLCVVRGNQAIMLGTPMANGGLGQKGIREKYSDCLSLGCYAQVSVYFSLLFYVGKQHLVVL
jgi:hypothetical protein